MKETATERAVTHEERKELMRSVEHFRVIFRALSAFPVRFATVRVRKGQEKILRLSKSWLKTWFSLSANAAVPFRESHCECMFAPAPQN